MIIRDKITAELNYQASVEGETGNIKMCRIILESVNNMVVYNTMVKVKKHQALTQKPTMSSISTM